MGVKPVADTSAMSSGDTVVDDGIHWGLALRWRSYEM